MAWIAEDERNMIGLIEVAELPERPVVAHHLAVVGGQGDDGAVPGSGCLQALDEPTDLAVDLRDHAPLGGANRAEGLPRQVGDAALGRVAPAERAGPGGVHTIAPEIGRGWRGE